MEAKATSTPRVLGGRYRLGRLLGRGGMGEVYEAVDERLARPVAVKILRASLARDDEVRRRFTEEARSSARLSHPNVVAVFDSGEEPDGTPFLVMERLPGETLADRMRAGPLDAAWVLLVAGDVLQALAAAHAAGIVHRDVKPGNVLIGADGCAKVADFGIAKSAEAAAGGDATATGQLLGTPAYLAPERLDGHPATPRSDVYAVGVMLYEALAGRKPFDADSPVGMAYAVRHATPPPLAEVRPDLDRRVVELVERAMAREEGDRFPSAEAMAAAVAAVPGAPAGEADDPTLLGRADRTVVVEAPAPAPRPVAGRARARRRIPVPVVLAGLALLAALVVLALAQDGPGGTDRAALAGSLEALAERVEVGDGPRGPDLADRLRAVAGDVRAGGGGIRATDTLRELETWHQQRLVFDTAYSEASALLRQVPGVQVPAAAPVTTAPPPSTTLPPSEDRAGDDGDDGKGRGKGKGKGDD